MVPEISDNYKKIFPNVWYVKLNVQSKYCWRLITTEINVNILAGHHDPERTQHDNQTGGPLPEKLTPARGVAKVGVASILDGSFDQGGVRLLQIPSPAKLVEKFDYSSGGVEDLGGA